MDLCNAQSKGHKIFLCVLHDLDFQQNGFFKSNLSDQIPLFCLRKKKGFDVLVILRLLFLILRIKPAVINTHLNSLLYVFIASIFYKIQLFHTVHNVAVKEQENKFLRKLYHFVFHVGRVVPIAISHEIKNTLIQEYKITDVPVIENGVGHPVLSDEYQSVSSFVNNLKGNSQTKILLCVARFSTQKNLSLLISSFNQVISDGADLRLLIIGDGPEQEKKSFNGNRRQARIFPRQ